MEKAALAVLLTYGDEKKPSLSRLSASSFFSPEHKEIWEAMEKVEKDGQVVDLLTVRQALKDNGSPVPNSALLALANAPVSLVSFPSYVKKVNEARKSAEVANACEKLAFMASGWNVNNAKVMETANTLISLCSPETDTSRIDWDAYENLVEFLEERKGKDLVGWSFGENLKWFDKYTRGLQRGKTYRIGAPSGTGKTQLSYSIINSCLKQGAKVAFFTLENSKNFTLTNLLANHQKVGSWKLERGDEQIDTSYLSEIADRFFLIDDAYEISDIFAKVMAIKPDVVFLDFISLVKINKFDDMAKYDEYANRVKEFVKTNDICWVDLSNLPKSAESEEAIKMGGGFHGSASLKNLVDVGIHIWADKDFAEFKKTVYGTPAFDKIRDLKALGMMITKNRIGTSFVETTFKADFGRWGYMTEATEEDRKLWTSSF